MESPSQLDPVCKRKTGKMERSTSLPGSKPVLEGEFCLPDGHFSGRDPDWPREWHSWEFQNATIHWQYYHRSSVCNWWQAAVAVRHSTMADQRQSYWLGIGAIQLSSTQRCVVRRSNLCPRGCDSAPAPPPG